MRTLDSISIQPPCLRGGRSPCRGLGADGRSPRGKCHDSSLRETATRCKTTRATEGTRYLEWAASVGLSGLGNRPRPRRSFDDIWRYCRDPGEDDGQDVSRFLSGERSTVHASESVHRFPMLETHLADFGQIPSRWSSLSKATVWS